MRARHLLAHRRVRQADAGHQRQRLDAAHGVLRRVGVDGRQRAVVAGVQRLEHVERLRPADLAHHDPVGPHPQRVAHQRPDRHLAAALEVRRPRLQAHHVALAQTQLGSVLDRHDPLRARDRARERVQRRRLARAGAAADEDRGARRHAQGQQLGRRRRRASRRPRGRAARSPRAESGAPSGTVPTATAARSRRSRASRRADARRRAARPRPRAGPAARGCARSRAAAPPPSRSSPPPRSSRPRRSTYTSPGPLTITSSTSGSASSGSSGPRPVASTTTRSHSAARSASSQRRRLALDQRPHPLGQRAIAGLPRPRALDQPPAQRHRQLVDASMPIEVHRARKFAPLILSNRCRAARSAPG